MSIFDQASLVQDNAKQKEIAENEDEFMADDGKDHVDSKPGTASKQNKKLYTAEGILNPHRRRAKKKRKNA